MTDRNIDRQIDRQIDIQKCSMLYRQGKKYMTFQIQYHEMGGNKITLIIINYIKEPVFWIKKNTTL